MKNTLLLILIILNSFISFAQNAPQSKYTDIKTSGDMVYALTRSNKIVAWDVKKDTILFVQKDVACIGIKNNGTIAQIATDGNIKEYNGSDWTTLGKAEGKPFALVYTSKNKHVAITSRGIYYNKRFFLPTESNRIGNGELSLSKKSLDEPSLVYIDNQDRLWITYNLGHFNDAYVFDTNKSLFVRDKILFVKDEKKEVDWDKYIKEYRNKQLKKYPFFVKKSGNDIVYKFPSEMPISYGIKSIAQDKKGSYYFSEGLAFSNKTGFFCYEKSNIPDFYRPKENIEKSLKQEGEILGPLVYNKFNDTFYYYSNMGFFQTSIGSSRTAKELIIDPNVLLYEGMIEHVYGHLMNVTKFEFLDKNRFVFLTTEYGFGYYDGENLNIYN